MIEEKEISVQEPLSTIGEPAALRKRLLALYISIEMNELSSSIEKLHNDSFGALIKESEINEELTIILNSVDKVET